MSSDSESDELYVPGESELKRQTELSEEESGNESDEQPDGEETSKSKKRKSKQPVRGRKKIKAKSITEISNDEHNEKDDEKDSLDPEEIKKREDEVWAKFLGKPKEDLPAKESKEINVTKPETILPPKNNISVKNDTKQDGEREKRIFEFAGETIVVENNVIKEKIKTEEKAPKVSKFQSPSGSGKGLSNILGQLNKKNKLSTLEKSKLDWNTYKREEGIEEEITSHNKGKAGYLDRRDFLERTDVRQYEIERDLRLSRRSKQ